MFLGGDGEDTHAMGRRCRRRLLSKRISELSLEGWVKINRKQRVRQQPIGKRETVSASWWEKGWHTCEAASHPDGGRMESESISVAGTTERRAILVQIKAAEVDWAPFQNNSQFATLIFSPKRRVLFHSGLYFSVWCNTDLWTEHLSTEWTNAWMHARRKSSMGLRSQRSCEQSTWKKYGFSQSIWLTLRKDVNFVGFFFFSSHLIHFLLPYIS